jgi:hypothetical protein
VVALGGFRIEGDAVEITCPECAQVYRIGSAAGELLESDPPPPRSSPRERGEGDECPKCGKVVAEDAAACAACGLRREKFAAFAAAPPDEPAPVAAAWAECRARWTDGDAHDRYLDAVAAAQAFGAGARRYREALRERPADERARRGLDRVTRMAEAALLGSPTRPRPSGPEPYKNLVLLLLVLVALGGIFGIYALFRARNAQEEQRQDDPAAPHREVRPTLKHSTPDHRR